MMQSIGLLGLILLLLLPIDALSAQQPRLQIPIYRYTGMQNSPGGFDSLYGILKDKTEQISERLSDLPVADYLGKLALTAPMNVPPENLDALRKAWRDLDALEILGGVISESNGRLHARSRVFLGEFGPADAGGKKEAVYLDLDLSDSQFGSIVDSHSLAILYALTIDALRAGRDREVVRRLMAEAADITADLRRRNALTGDLELVARALAGLQIPPAPP